MHTHHKILWSMALLACGSFLTPVKGTPTIENNLTDYVQAVSTKVADSPLGTTVAQAIENQTNRLQSGAPDLSKAINAVELAVGYVVDVNDPLGGTGNDVLTNVNISTTALKNGEKVLATAVTSVQGVLKDGNNAIPGKDVCEQLDSLLSKINKLPMGTYTIVTPENRFSNLYEFYLALSNIRP